MIIPEVMFKKFSIDEAWEIHTQVQKENAELRQTIEELNRIKDRVHALELAKAEQATELLATNTEMKELRKEVMDTKKKQLRTNQYGRLENIEISGIPTNVDNEHLEEKVQEVLQKIDVEVKRRDMAACHRLGKARKTTIVRFANRKNADKVFKNIRKTKDANFDDVLPRGSKVYINANLCPEFKDIFYKLKLCKQEGLIHGYGTDRRGAYAYMEAEGGRKTRVELDSDFTDILGIAQEDLLHFVQRQQQHTRHANEDNEEG